MVNAAASSENGLGRGCARGPRWKRERSPSRQFRRMALWLPDLDAVGIFILGKAIHGADKLHRAGLLL